MSNLNITQNLTAEHIDHLKKSGLNEQTITMAGLFSVDKEKAQKILRMSNVGSGLAFPYPHLEGFVRIRLDEPLISSKHDDGYGNVRRQREIRYLSPKGSVNHLYLPVPNEVLEGDCRLCIAEGEKKAIALTQAGLPTVGLAGVYAWRTGKGVCNEFNLINWMNRQVTVVFDSDATIKRPVYQAMKALANELSDRGAEVAVCITPPLGGAHSDS